MVGPDVSRAREYRANQQKKGGICLRTTKDSRNVRGIYHMFTRRAIKKTHT